MLTTICSAGPIVGSAVSEGGSMIESAFHKLPRQFGRREVPLRLVPAEPLAAGEIVECTFTSDDGVHFGVVTDVKGNVLRSIRMALPRR